MAVRVDDDLELIALVASPSSITISDLHVDLDDLDVIFRQNLPCDKAVLDEGFIGWEHFTEGSADAAKAQHISQHDVPQDR